MGALRSHLLGLLIVAFGYALLLPDIDVAPLNTWDDSFYGSAAQAMREHGRYLFTVNDSGDYAMQGLSKPPLFLWTLILSLEAFDSPLFALRFPSATATVLTAYVLYWYGRRLAPGTPLGSALGLCSGLIALAHAGAREFGQNVCIEPVFTLFLCLALFAYAEAMSAERREGLIFAGVSGTCMGLAFLTKQAAAGTVVFAVVAVELVTCWRRPRPALARLAVAAVPSVALSGGWLYLAYREVGSKLIEVFFDKSLVHRVGGFSGTRHYAWLNRMAEELDRVLAPLPWEVGIVGVTLLAVVILLGRGEAPSESVLVPNPRRRAFYLLPAFYALTWIIVYGNVSQSLLAWYTVGFVFPNALGLGFLLAAPFCIGEARVGGRRVAERDAALGVALGGAAIVAALLVASRAVDKVLSRLNLAVGISLLLAVALWQGARLAPVARFALGEGRRAVVGPLVLATLLLAVRTREAPDAFELLVQEFNRRGAKKVWVDPQYPPGMERARRLKSQLGPNRLVEGEPPWSKPPPRRVDVAVYAGALPNEASVAPGLDVMRVPGLFAFFGNLRHPPYEPDSTHAALENGPLTLEAEHLESELRGALVEDPHASGGGARRYPRSGIGRSHDRALSRGVVSGFKAGSYVARFRIAFECSGLPRRELVANLVLRQDKPKLASRDILCNVGDEARAYYDVDVAFELTEPGPLIVEVMYRRGRLHHDKTELWATNVLASRGHRR